MLLCSPLMMRKSLGSLCLLGALLGGLLSSPGNLEAGDDLRLSVYCTAGDVQRHLATPAGREKALQALRPLNPSRLFLEGRRGDEYVSPAQMGEVCEFFEARNIQCSGGIATVPGRVIWSPANRRTVVAELGKPQNSEGCGGVFHRKCPLI